MVPARLRQSRIAARLKTLLPHDATYDARYYANDVEEAAVRSAGVISASIVSDLRPRTVVDVGCGTGALLEQMAKRGCDAFGLEYSRAALKYCRERQLNVRRFDIGRDTLEEGTRFDVAISMEVAEHLPERLAERFVDLLSRLSRVIVFTAARPGQGGTDHVNEQPQSYWLAKFEGRGFLLDPELTDKWRKQWTAENVESWYAGNLMILRNR